jgi:ubiquinone biosynthesis monooxygenase Coq7
LALKTFKQNEYLKKSIEEMKEHENEHYDFFNSEIKKRNLAPTKFLPLRDLMGVTLGFGTAMLGEKAAMLCTASVEEVIDGHYKDQTYKLGEDEKELKEKIIKFREDELHHKEIAYDNGATKEGLFGVLDKIIKTSSKIAIKISEKI